MPGARMTFARFLDCVLALLLCLLSSLQRVIANQVIIKCNTLILFIVFMVMIPLLFIWSLVKHFCFKCREPEENLRRNLQIPPEAPTIAPIDMMWVNILDPPPPYVEVILNPEEPPPPYSLRPEDPAGQMRCTYSTAF
ncbi:transmembrane protein 92-like [Mesocricetus auratus]|uniref:Transmembrane protein 92-like n=1 Tax=Mesocricetus auratus TaxID=10036 RepID=A0ABM2XT69_MESAU|nr:transmembrane protein 92-like [Mesocricetus auratus]